MNVSKLASPTNVGEILTHFCLNCRFFCLFSLSPKSRLSGFQLPSSIVSTGSLLTLWFTTDFAVSAQGFKAMYEGRRLLCLASYNRTCCWGDDGVNAEWTHGGSTGLFFNMLTKWHAGVDCNCQRTQPKNRLEFSFSGLNVWIRLFC